MARYLEGATVFVIGEGDVRLKIAARVFAAGGYFVAGVDKKAPKPVMVVATADAVAQQDVRVKVFERSKHTTVVTEAWLDACEAAGNWEEVDATEFACGGNDKKRKRGDGKREEESDEEMEGVDDAPDKEERLKGCTVALSGKLSQSRVLVTQALVEHGGVTCSSVTTKTDVLVSTPDEVRKATVKVKAAKKHGVPIVCEEFLVQAYKRGWQSLDVVDFPVEGARKRARGRPRAGAGGNAGAGASAGQVSITSLDSRVLSTVFEYFQTDEVSAMAATCKLFQAAAACCHVVHPAQWDDEVVEHVCRLTDEEFMQVGDWCMLTAKTDGGEDGGEDESKSAAPSPPAPATLSLGSLFPGLFMSTEPGTSLVMRSKPEGFDEKYPGYSNEWVTLTACIATNHKALRDLDLKALTATYRPSKPMTEANNRPWRADAEDEFAAAAYDVDYAAQVVGISHDCRTVTIRLDLPMDMEQFRDLEWSSGGSSGVEFSVVSVPLTSYLRSMQFDRVVREGVSWRDGLLGTALIASLNDRIDKLKAAEPADYHPHSNNVVRDLVHPALFSYVQGVSTFEPSEHAPTPDHRPLTNVEDSHHHLPSWGQDPAELTRSDMWARPYEDSKYQWLPSIFAVDDRGVTTIKTYINNLDRDKYADLYSDIEHAFSAVLPHLEACVGYGMTMPFHNGEMDGGDGPNEVKIEAQSLRGRELQVITKIVDYELNDGQRYEGVWHVEGMSHENIVATSVTVLQRSKSVQGGALLFKRPFTSHEAMVALGSVPQERGPQHDKWLRDGVVPLGSLGTPEHRTLCFPNSHIHRVAKMQAKGDKGTRRILVFFLVNPDRYIVSTREVPKQQGVMSLDSAKEHRLQLMQERKRHKQSMNVREVELCEH